MYHIAVAPNSAYVNYTIVLLESLFQTNADKDFHVWIMYHDLKKTEIAFMSDYIKKRGAKVSFLYIDDTKYNVFQWTERFSVETYFRLELQDILPEEVERILYLDGDMIIAGDIADLYDVDFEGNSIAACGFSPRLEQGDEFNAGMILFNIEKMRGNISFDAYVELAEKLHWDFYQDQGLLNEMFGKNDTKYMSKYKYNFTCSFYRKFKDEIRKETPNLSFKDIVIIHYAGPGIRPWQAYFDAREVEMFHKSNLKDVMATNGYIIDDLYLELLEKWWAVARVTPVADELWNTMWSKKSQIYSEVINALIDSKDYRMGTMLLKFPRSLRR